MTNARIGTHGYHALDIARYVLKYETHNGHVVSNLKLQKILYFLQAESLVATGKTLFVEPIIAWDSGPIVEPVYHMYKVFGSASIPMVAIERDAKNLYIYEKDQEMINGILEEARKYSACQLLHLIHNQMPWKRGRARFNNQIFSADLIEFFSE